MKESDSHPLFRICLKASFCVWFGISPSPAASDGGIHPEALQQERRTRSPRKTDIESGSRALFERGIKHYNAGRYYSALDIFRRLSRQSLSNNRQLSASYLMAMKCHIQVDNVDDAVQIGRRFLSTFPTSSYLPHIQECFGDVFVKKGHYASSARSYLGARSGSESELLTQRLDDKLKHLSNGLLKSGEVEDLLAFEMNPTNRSILTLMMAGAHLMEGNSNSVALALLKMDLDVLPSTFRDLYDALRQKTYLQSGESVVIGVILPLTGYEEKIGRAFLEGLQSAVEAMKERMSLSVILEVVDNGGENLRTVSGVKTLAANPNVVSIIGPISTVNAVTASAALQQSDVPLLVPVSPQVGLGSVGDNIFQMGLNLRKQGRYAADYAVQSLGFGKLAVVAPADRFGKGLSDGFLERADELGADIVAVEWYSGIPVDLSKQFNSLRKAAFELLTLEPDTSGDEFSLDSLERVFVIREEDFFPDEQARKDLSPEDSSEIVLSTIDGIYLPIHLGDINYVASQFSTYNLDAQLLGNANWYDPEVVDQQLIGPNVEGLTIVVDYSESDGEWARPMTDASIFAAHNRDALRMAVSAYDIMTFLGGQFGDDPNRLSVLENLNRSQSFRGMAKVISFKDSPRRVNSSALILEYRNGKFTEVGQFDSDSLLTGGLQSP